MDTSHNSNLAQALNKSSVIKTMQFNVLYQLIKTHLEHTIKTAIIEYQRNNSLK